ncbi:MAG: hypothetical protein KDB22_14450 [Planctomycetales bacterium]|nr:hypothetical protein [Planctomycetales bacterium]
MSQFPPPADDTNPYAPTSAFSTAQYQASTDAEFIRKQYLSHEASTKSIGVLYLLGAIFLVPVGVGFFGWGIYGIATGEMEALIGLVLGMVYLTLGVGQGLTGIGLRRLRPWARIVGIVFSVIGLIGFPIGTLISGYFLYLLASQKGVYIFSDEYRRIIESTPHIKYKTSIVVWILLGLLVLLFVLAMIAAFSSR